MKRLSLLLTISVILNVILVSAFLSHKSKEEAGHAHGKEEGHHEEEGSHLAVSRESQELIGIETIEAKLTPFAEKLPVTGQIAQDSQQTTTVTAPQAGVFMDGLTNVGRLVKKEDLLGRIRTHRMENSDLEVKSPVDGVVIASFVKTGDKVDGVTALYTIADLSALQATFDVYEKDIGKVKDGQKMIVRSTASPENAFEGYIGFISPRVDEDTYTVKVRASVNNPDYALKLGMFVTGEILNESDAKYIVVPREAVHLINGKNIVFVRKGEQEFEAREVTVVKESTTEAALEGVNEGESIVTKDGFLLKSELLKSKMGEGCAE